MVGFEANITGGAYPTWNGYYKGSLFTKRDANIQYTLEEINGHNGINDMALVSTGVMLNLLLQMKTHSIMVDLTLIILQQIWLGYSKKIIRLLL